MNQHVLDLVQLSVAWHKQHFLAHLAQDKGTCSWWLPSGGSHTFVSKCLLHSLAEWQLEVNLWRPEKLHQCGAVCAGALLSTAHNIPRRIEEEELVLWLLLEELSCWLSALNLVLLIIWGAQGLIIGNGYAHLGEMLNLQGNLVCCWISWRSSLYWLSWRELSSLSLFSPNTFYFKKKKKKEEQGKKLRQNYKTH